MKTIITHNSPDLDAVCALWLLKKYLPGWSRANILFVQAGDTIDGKPPDINPDMIHVDTGLGKFDHHQTQDKTSSSEKVLLFLLQNKHIKGRDEKILIRLTNIITSIDHFEDVSFPEAENDRYIFFAPSILVGYKATSNNNNEICAFGEKLIQSIFNSMRYRVLAEKEITNGLSVKTKYGKTLIINSKNVQAVNLALRIGFKMAIIKDPETGFTNIYLHPKSRMSLSSLHKKIKKRDPLTRWFLHASEKMIINGPKYRKGARPTRLNPRQILDLTI